MPQTELAIQNEPSDESKHTATMDGIFVGNQNNVLREGESWRKVYATVKFIPDGLYQTEFAVSVLPTTIPSDCMDIDEVAVPVPQEMYEPARCLKDGAPPKRFYRTFWRSVMRRILASSSRK